MKYRDFGQNDHTFHKMYKETVFSSDSSKLRQSGSQPKTVMKYGFNLSFMRVHAMHELLQNYTPNE